MKNNIDLHSVFQEIDPEDFNLEEGENQSAQVSPDNIRKMTMDKVKEDKQTKINPFKKHIMRYALIACTLIVISGITVLAAANAEVKQTISNIFGISQIEIISIGESIESKDYRLTVHEITCDSQRGVVVVSVDALSDNAIESFHLDNIHNKFGHIGGVAYGIRELEKYRQEYTQYFQFSFFISSQGEIEHGLTFTMEGMKQNINIPIAQTIDLNGLDMDIIATEEYPVSYNMMKYSEIGFTLLGTGELEEPNQRIIIEFVDGSISEIFSGYNEHPESQVSDETSVSVTNKSGEQVVSVKSTEVIGELKSAIVDTEWISGYSYGNYAGEIIYNFSFEKKMDWTKVESITISNTVIQMQP